MHRCESKLELILQLSQALLHHRDAESFFGAVLESLRNLWDIDAAGFGRVRLDEGVMEAISFYSVFSEFHRTPGQRIELTPNIPAGWVSRHRKVLLVRDTADVSAQEPLDFSGFPNLRSGIGAPLERAGNVIGTMFVASKNPRQFTEEDLALVEVIRPILAVALENALAFEELDKLRRLAVEEGLCLREEITDKFPVDGMIGTSRPWKSILSQVRSIGPTQATALILGETGTGKELVARAIHDRSRRSNGPFIKVNCGALTESLIESELFGHERGAFTGAHQRRLGRFEVADGGTLFLDEIGEMPLASQVKLLRALENRVIERVGGSRPVPVDVRIIAATNRDLEMEVESGRFRADLFYRLNVVTLRMPALRERSDDIPLLAQYFLEVHSSRHCRQGAFFSPASRQALLTYAWPGNVRELEHLVERAVILSPALEIDVEPYLMPLGPLPLRGLLKPESPLPMALPTMQDLGGSVIPMKSSFAEAERELIQRALRETRGVIGGRHGAAARLGLKRQTLQSKMKKHGLDTQEYRAAATPTR